LDGITFDIHELDGTDRVSVDEGHQLLHAKSQPIVGRRAIEHGETI
jgi:hypothetical protein